MAKRLLGICLGLLALSAAPASAQLPGLELEPYVGAYIPAQSLVDQSIVGVNLTAQAQTALAIGGRLTAMLTGPIGVEGNFMYAFSEGESAVDGTTDPQEKGAVWAGDGRLLWKIVPGPIGVHVNGGVAIVGRSGDFYSDVTNGKTNVGGVVGLGARFSLPGTFAIRVDGDTYLYNAEFTVTDEVLGDVTFDKQFQADVVLSAGLVIALI